MANPFEHFERAVRRARSVTEARSEPVGGSHPFDERNIHSRIHTTSKKLFDDGHYALATFEAYKLVDKEVAALAKVNESGVKLMMRAFSEQTPLISLADLSTTSGKDEQEGYKFIFQDRLWQYGIQEDTSTESKIRRLNAWII